MRFRRLRFAPPELSIEDPHKWWNLVATAGLSGRVSGEDWNKLFAELGELLIFAPNDLAKLRADQLHIVSDSEESNRLLGQLWTAVQASGDAKDFSKRANQSVYARRGWDAFQPAGAITADSEVRSLGDPPPLRRGARPGHGGM